ncbi:MAG: histidine kinase [Ancrocorticia sp.]
MLLCTYQVKWAALAGGVLIAAAALTGDIKPAFNMFIFVPVAVCAFSRWPVVASTIFGYSVISVLGQLYNEHGARSTLSIFTMLAGSSLIGLTVRLLLARSRWAGKRIRSLEDAATELRELERQTLAGELTGLLSKELSDQRKRLEDARGETEPEVLAQLLEGTARGARAALSQLRELVQALRGREEASLPMEAGVGLVEAVESVDDLLTGYGFWVEIDTSQISRPPSATASRLLGEFVRAAGACVLAHAQPGDHCALSVSSDDGGASVRFVSSSVIDSHDLAQARSRIEAMGGSMQTRSGGGVTAVLRVNPMEGDGARSGGARGDGPEAWNIESTARVALTMILLLAGLIVAVPLPSHDSHSEHILWGFFLMALGLSLWWPLWSGILAANIFLAGVWLLEPTVVIGVSNLPFVVLLAMATVYMPRWIVVFLLLGAARYWLWFGEITVDVGFATIIYGGVGILAGMVARYFLLLRAKQYTELSDAAAEREKARSMVRVELAGELHDIVAHQLTLLALNMDTHREQTDPLVLRGALDRADTILASAQADLAFLLYLLRTPGDETPEKGLLGPRAAVDAAVKALRASGRNVEVTLDSAVDDVDPTTSRTLARVVREASTNILRYAPKRAACAISVEQDAEGIHVEVRSELSGEAARGKSGRAADSTGLGLVGLSERLRLTGGSLSAGKEHGEWVVRARLPVSR